jgi:succinate dehydrogenase / fumarate reductase membrane anchor subunit
MSMRTPLGRVLGLGAAREGTILFWRQRLTGLAVLLLAIVLAVLALVMIGRDFAEARDLVGHPVVAGLLILFIAAGAYHMKIGMAEIIEDYVHAERLRIAVRVANAFFCYAAGLAAILAVLMIAFGA